MLYQELKLSVMVLAVAADLSLIPIFAQEPLERDRQPRLQAESMDVGIPACLVKLNLSEQQQKQIKEIVNKYDQDLAMVWNKFGDRYLDTIRTEALLLTAIEDKLTDAQREQVRDQRRRTAHQQKSLQSTEVKPNQATSKPPSAVEEEIAIVGVALTAEQQVAADALQEKYLSQLRSLNRDIEGLHMQLVSLEADKIVAIEKVLTKEQLLQLREIRQNAPPTSKIADRQAGRRGPSKTE